jgi:hypothetical protein
MIRGRTAEIAIDFANTINRRQGIPRRPEQGPGEVTHHGIRFVYEVKRSKERADELEMLVDVIPLVSSEDTSSLGSITKDLKEYAKWFSEWEVYSATNPHKYARLGKSRVNGIEDMKKQVTFVEATSPQLGLLKLHYHLHKGLSDAMLAPGRMDEQTKKTLLTMIVAPLSWWAQTNYQDRKMGN